MSIQGRVNELSSIKSELTSLRKRATNLRKRSKNIEQEIEDYLESKDQPGMKYKGMAIIRENKIVNKPKHKNDQKADTISILEKHGVDSPEKVYEELIQARKGEIIEKSKLKIKTYKN
jgi:hypothetical protein